MKKRKDTIIHIINWCLLFSLPLMLVTVKIQTNTVSSFSDTKKLSTNLFSKVEEVVAIRVESQDENNNDKSDNNNDDANALNSSNGLEKTSTSISKSTISHEEVKQEKSKDVSEPAKEEPVSHDFLTSYTGKMSFYNANCTGCSGITSTGVDVSDGKIYYQDGQYGQVRIVAAGSEISKWSIVRIKNSSLGSNVLAIVLDRGGDIGVGKKFLIDMLTNNSEGIGGVQDNITVEVLRAGK